MYFLVPGPVCLVGPVRRVEVQGPRLAAGQGWLPKYRRLGLSILGMSLLFRPMWAGLEGP